MICSNEDRRHLLIPNYPELSLRKQCELLGINRSSYYYEQKPIDEEMLFLMRLVDEIYTAHPYFGSRQMVNYLRLKGLVTIHHNHAFNMVLKKLKFFLT